MKPSSARTASRLKKYKSSIPVSNTSLGVTIVCVVMLVVPYLFSSRAQVSGEIVNNDPVRIVFVGDIMMDRGVERNIEKNFGGDYNELFKHTEYIKNADIAFGNIEGPIATSGKNVGSEYSFRMNPEALDALVSAGFDIVSFANNHVGDYSQDAFNETLNRFIEKNILYTGAGKNIQESLTPAVITVRGVTVGFLGSTDVGPNWMGAGETKPGIAIARDKEFKAAIAEADKKVDILVVSYHFGNEYSPVSDTQRKLAREAVDNGADIVVGHHAHVIQATEVYKNKPIFYGLGNFIFDQYFSEHTMRGMVVEVFIDTKTKDITHNRFISPMNKKFIPQPLETFTESFVVKKTFQP